MGHCHSPAQLGSHRGVYAAGERAGGAVAQRGGEFRSLGARLTRQLLVAAIRAYQLLLAPYLGGACKFYPSCSAYALEAVERWGAWRGARLAARRLLRCRPFSHGGWDPVPEVEEELG
jgi:uncharacterized protein